MSKPSPANVVAMPIISMPPYPPRIPVKSWLPDRELLALRLLERVDLAGDALVVEPQLGHGDLGALGEVFGHLPGEPAGPLGGPDEVGRRGRGDLLVEPVGELLPHLGRVGVVDELLGLAPDRAQPVAQVVLDVGLQVGHAVVQGDLPA